MKETEMKRIFIYTAFLSCTFCLLFSSPLFAGTKEIHATYKYTLGDSDTKTDAKKIAFIKAKRLCLEKVGNYIQSKTVVSDFKLTKDEIISYTGGILRVSVVSEKFKPVGETFTLIMEVKALVDTNQLRDSFRRIQGDSDYATKIREQSEQMRELEEKVRKLQQQLSDTNYEKTTSVRRERKEVFDEIGELESIRHEIKSKTSRAVQNIELGMTKDEVKRLLGYPVAEGHYGYIYRNVWIVFNEGIVGCIVKANTMQ